MRKRKITGIFIFFIFTILFVHSPVMGLTSDLQPAWEIPLMPADNPANQTPVIQASDNRQLITLNFKYEPTFFVYDGNGSFLWNYTLTAEKTPWLSSISIAPDGTGLAITQFLPGCCHGSVSNTSSNKVIFFDKFGGRLWEYATYSPPLTSAVLKNTYDILVGTEDGQILCLDRHGSVRWTTTVDAPVTTLASSPDGSTIVATGDSNYYFSTLYGEPLNPYDFFTLDANGTVLWKYQTRGQNTVAVSRDGSTIAAIGGRFGNLMVFNRSGTKLFERSFPGVTSALSMTGDGNQSVVETADGLVYCLDHNGSPVWNVSVEPGSQGMAVGSTGDNIVIGNNRTIIVYSIMGDVLGMYPAGSRVLSVTPVPGSESFIIGTEQKILFLNVNGSDPDGMFPASSSLTTTQPAIPTQRTSTSTPTSVFIPVFALAIGVIGVILFRRPL